MANGPDNPKALLEEAAARMGEALARLAAQLDPFPAFLGMATIQAIELEPPPGAPSDLGCVVVLPSGELAELDLAVIPGPNGPADVDQVDQYRGLDLPVEEYVFYAAQAVRVLYHECRRRGLAP